MNSRHLVAALLATAALPALAQPAGFAGRDWTVTSLAGVESPGERPPTFRFDGEGRVAGFSGCNRFFGSYAGYAASVSLSPLGMTRMACPGPAAAIETAFVAAFRDRLGISLEADGTLVLSGAGGAVIRAR